MDSRKNELERESHHYREALLIPSLEQHGGCGCVGSAGGDRYMRMKKKGNGSHEAEWVLFKAGLGAIKLPQETGDEEKLQRSRSVVGRKVNRRQTKPRWVSGQNTKGKVKPCWRAMERKLFLREDKRNEVVTPETFFAEKAQSGAAERKLIGKCAQRDRGNSLAWGGRKGQVNWRHNSVLARNIESRKSYEERKAKGRE